MTDHLQEAVEATAKTLVGLGARREIIKIATPILEAHYREKLEARLHALPKLAAGRWVRWSEVSAALQVEEADCD